VIEWTAYKHQVDGNVFDWIVRVAEVRRQLRRSEKNRAIGKAAEEPKGLDEPKVENKKWKTVHARR
jgi:hypothetical protein